MYLHIVQWLEEVDRVHVQPEITPVFGRTGEGEVSSYRGVGGVDSLVEAFA